MASALVESARSAGRRGVVGRWAWGRSPGSDAWREGASGGGGAAADGGRSAPPSAGVGRYLDPVPRCGVSSQVGGLIVWSLASEGERRVVGGSVQPVGLPVAGELAEQVVRGWLLPERAAVALRDGGLDLRRVAGRCACGLDAAGLSSAQRSPPHRAPGHRRGWG